MIWNNKNNIEVPQAGKSYIFMNYNYESFWVYAINGTENIIDNGQKYEDNCINISKVLHWQSFRGKCIL